MSKKNLKPILSIVVAMDENRLIGVNNRLPWRLPADMRHFRNLTRNHVIIMGRKTYESIGKPLSDRINIVLTQNQHYIAPGCLVTHSVHEALKIAQENCNKQAPTETVDANKHNMHAVSPTRHEVFVLGGGEVYRLLLPYCERVYLTIVHHQFKGDSYFPVLPSADWQEVDRMDCMADVDNPYDYSFVCLDRKVKENA